MDIPKDSNNLTWTVETIIVSGTENDVQMLANTIDEKLKGRHVHHLANVKWHSEVISLYVIVV